MALMFFYFCNIIFCLITIMADYASYDNYVENLCGHNLKSIIHDLDNREIAYAKSMGLPVSNRPNINQMDAVRLYDLASSYPSLLKDLKTRFDGTNVSHRIVTHAAVRARARAAAPAIVPAQVMARVRAALGLRIPAAQGVAHGGVLRGILIDHEGAGARGGVGRDRAQGFGVRQFFSGEGAGARGGVGVDRTSSEGRKARIQQALRLQIPEEMAIGPLPVGSLPLTILDRQEGENVSSEDSDDSADIRGTFTDSDDEHAFQSWRGENREYREHHGEHREGTTWWHTTRQQRHVWDRTRGAAHRAETAAARGEHYAGGGAERERIAHARDRADMTHYGEDTMDSLRAGGALDRAEDRQEGGGGGTPRPVAHSHLRATRKKDKGEL